MGDRIVEVIIKARDTTAAVVGRFRRNWKSVERVIRDVTRAVVASTAAMAAAVVGMTKLSERGDKVNAVKRAFAKLTRDETAALRELREASDGTISDFELMARHNQALTLGAADTTAQFAEMVRISRELGRAQGIDAALALESLTTGLGRQSKLFLDNLGILVDTEGAYEAYARSLGKTASQLTDNEKRTAFLTAAMEQARRKAAELRTEQAENASWAARFSTAMSNLRDKLATFVADSPDLAEFFGAFTDTIDHIAETVASGDTDLLKKAFEQLGVIAGNAFSIGMEKALRATRGFVDRMAEALAGEMSENERRALEADRAAPGGDRRSIFGFLFDKVEGALSGSADLAIENIQVAQGILAELAAEAAQRRAEREAGAGGGGGGGGGFGADGGGDPFEIARARFRAAPAGFSSDAIAAFQARRSRVRSARAGPSVLVPGSFGLAPGLASRGLTDTERGVVDAETIRAGSDAMAEAGQVVTASMFGMAQAAIRGSDQVAQSVVSMITQIVQSLPGVGGIFGTVVAGVGGLVSAALGRNRDAVPVRIRDIDDAAARKLEQANGDVRITTIIEQGGVEIERIERELIDRANRNATVRYSRGRALVGG